MLYQSKNLLEYLIILNYRGKSCTLFTFTSPNVDYNGFLTNLKGYGLRHDNDRFLSIEARTKKRVNINIDLLSVINAIVI